MAARMTFALSLLLAVLVACDATAPVEGASAAESMDALPSADELTRENPVAFIESPGPNFYTIYNPKVVSADGVLWHSHKNCPGSPPNYAFPLSEPLGVSDGLQRITMACQYKHN